MPSTQDSLVGSGSSGANIVRRNSEDVGWQFGYLPNPNDQNTVKCKLCGHVSKGGIFRLKKHIAGIKGDVRSCSKASAEDKKVCKMAVDEASRRRTIKQRHNTEHRKEVSLPNEEVEDLEVNPSLASKRPRIFGPIDRFEIDPEESIREREKGKENAKQTFIKDAFQKEARERVNQYVARWIYQVGIPFHAVTHDSFTSMLEAIGAYGRGYKGPSMYELSEPFLRKEVDKTKADLLPHKEEWKRTGCSIMIDTWTDRRHRSIMNMCVNCKLGTIFHRSIECSKETHTGQFIFEWVDKCIDEIGAEHILQVMTDNASTNMATATLLRQKHPSIYWTSCASHTIDLVLEEIRKKDKFKSAIEKGRALTVFIYSHYKTLAMMRRFTQKKDIVRPGITRFATSFLTLQSLLEKKEKLRLMLTSDEWITCKWSKMAKGRAAAATVLTTSFWSTVSLALRVFSPLVRVLRIADGDRKQAMGFIVGSLWDAKREIMVAYMGVEAGYNPILNAMKEKTKGRLNTPLHMAGFFLNPWYYFKYQEKIRKDPNVASGLCSAIENFYTLSDQQDEIMKEVAIYKSASGLFGRPMAVRQRSKNDDNFDAGNWWSIFGSGTPLLQDMAIKILSLTSSSSGCERNWSTFEGIHTKKRNRLESTKLNNLVYVQFNAKLKAQRKVKNDGKEIDPLITKEGRNVVAWLVEGDEEDEEIFSGTGLTWRVVGEASGVNEVLQPRRSTRGGAHSQLRDINESEELDDAEEEENKSEEGGKVELDDDSDDDELLSDNFDDD